MSYIFTVRSVWTSQSMPAKVLNNPRDIIAHFGGPHELVAKLKEYRVKVTIHAVRKWAYRGIPASHFLTLQDIFEAEGGTVKLSRPRP